MSGNSRSMLELADHVIEKDLPLLFLDTCALLDIIRAPFRHDKAEDAIQTISGAVQLVDRQDEFVLAISSIISDEFHANRSKVAGELTKHCRSLIDGMTMIDGLLAILGLQAHRLSPDDSMLKFESRLGELMLKLESRLGKLADQLLANAMKFDQEDAIKLKAFDRLAARIPPGHRGDQGKDCLVFEELLEFSRLAREKNHRGKIVFCTSNTKDYCTFRSDAHPEIVSELDPVNVTFTTKLSWAFDELNLP